MRNIIFLAAGTADKMNKYVNDQSGSNINSLINKEANNHISFKSTLGFITTLSRWARILDIVSILFVLVGTTIMASSLIGNNGKWRELGRGMIIGGYAWVIIAHVAIIAGTAFGNMGHGKIFMFVLMLLGQVLVYVASSTLFTIGSHQMEIYEMGGQPSNSRNQISAYNFIFVVMAAGAISYLMVGLL